MHVRLPSLCKHLVCVWVRLRAVAVYPGMTAFAPVCWSANKYTGVAPHDDWYTGNWRSSGSGMIAFYASDFYSAGGCVPMADRAVYGKEDHEFSMLLRNSGKVHLQRACTPELWHLYHSKANWGVSLNGMRHKKPGAKAGHGGKGASAASGGNTTRTADVVPRKGKDVTVGDNSGGDSDSDGVEELASGSEWKLAMPRPDGPEVIQNRLGARLDGYRCTRLLTSMYV